MASILPQVPSLNPTPLLGFQPAARANAFTAILQGINAGLAQKREEEARQHRQALELRNQGFRESEADRRFELDSQLASQDNLYRLRSMDLQEQRVGLEEKRFGLATRQAELSMQREGMLIDSLERQGALEESDFQTRMTLSQSIDDEIRGITTPVRSRSVRGDFSGITADQVAKGLGANLAPHAQDFVDAGRKYGLDPRFLASISKFETGNGTSSAFRNKRNAMGISNASGPIALSSVRESIMQQAKSLSKKGGFYDGKDSIAAIGSVYAPPGAGNDPNGTNHSWPKHVGKFYSEYLGRGASAQGQLERLRKIERRGLGEEQQRMVEATRSQIRARNPEAYDRDLASRQLETLKAAAIGAERRQFLTEGFEPEMKALADGRPLNDQAFQTAVQAVQSVDLNSTAAGFKSPLAGQNETVLGLASSAAAIGMIEQAYSDFARTGKVDNNAVVGAFRTAVAKFGLDKPAEFLKGVTESAVPGFARALGHTGVLTELDVESVRSALPNSASTEEVAIKLANVMRANIKRQSLNALDSLQQRGSDIRPTIRTFARNGIKFTQQDLSPYGLEVDEVRALLGTGGLRDGPSGRVYTIGHRIMKDGVRYEYKGGDPNQESSWKRVEVK